MKRLELARSGEALSVLCLGAHSDDLEIGIGATLLSLAERGVRLDVHWCVLSGASKRGQEARDAGADLLSVVQTSRIEVLEFEDGFFPEASRALKTWFEQLKPRVNPDLILTHRHADAHQDHREVCRLTWNTFRDHLILEYEIPKWDGDMGQPNFYVPVSAAALERKV